MYEQSDVLVLYYVNVGIGLALHKPFFRKKLKKILMSLLDIGIENSLSFQKAADHLGHVRDPLLLTLFPLPILHETRKFMRSQKCIAMPITGLCLQCQVLMALP